MITARTFPEATEEVAAYLLARLSVPVRWQVPNPRPESFVLVQRGGGDVDQWQERADFDVQCWAGTANANPRAAHTLANQVKAALLVAPNAVNPIRRVRVGGLAFLPDAQSQVPRVLMAATVWLAAE